VRVEDLLCQGQLARGSQYTAYFFEPREKFGIRGRAGGEVDIACRGQVVRCRKITAREWVRLAEGGQQVRLEMSAFCTFSLVLEKRHNVTAMVLLNRDSSHAAFMLHSPCNWPPGQHEVFVTASLEIDCGVDTVEVNCPSQKTYCDFGRSGLGARTRALLPNSGERLGSSGDQWNSREKSSAFASPCSES
jgi:hypothetical protein